MSRSHAEEYAITISKAFGRAVLIRERARRESYQVLARDLGETINPALGLVVGEYVNGVLA